MTIVDMATSLVTPQPSSGPFYTGPAGPVGTFPTQPFGPISYPIGDPAAFQIGQNQIINLLDPYPGPLDQVIDFLRVIKDITVPPTSPTPTIQQYPPPGDK
jgi:hypothetical protein